MFDLILVPDPVPNGTGKIANSFGNEETEAKTR